MNYSYMIIVLNYDVNDSGRGFGLLRESSPSLHETASESTCVPAATAHRINAASCATRVKSIQMMFLEVVSDLPATAVADVCTLRLGPTTRCARALLNWTAPFRVSVLEDKVAAVLVRAYCVVCIIAAEDIV